MGQFRDTLEISSAKFLPRQLHKLVLGKLSQIGRHDPQDGLLENYK